MSRADVLRAAASIAGILAELPSAADAEEALLLAYEPVIEAPLEVPEATDRLDDVIEVVSKTSRPVSFAQLARALDVSPVVARKWALRGVEQGRLAQVGKRVVLAGGAG